MRLLKNISSYDICENFVLYVFKGDTKSLRKIIFTFTKKICENTTKIFIMQEIRFTSDKQYLFCRLFCISLWWPISLIWYKLKYEVKLKGKSEFKIKFELEIDFEFGFELEFKIELETEFETQINF